MSTIVSQFPRIYAAPLPPAPDRSPAAGASATGSEPQAAVDEPGTPLPDRGSADDGSGASSQSEKAEGTGTAPSALQSSSGPASPPGEHRLSQGEKLAVTRLQKTDAAVHAHEMAHLAAAGTYARSGASYRYKRGPDGKEYAVAGDVKIDASKDSDPDETIRKMRTVQQAALAPIDPSPQDRKVAAKADAMIAEAHQELIKLQEAKTKAEEAHKEAAHPEKKTAAETAPAGSAGGGKTDTAAAEPPSRFRVHAAAAYRNTIVRQQTGGGLHLLA